MPTYSYINKAGKNVTVEAADPNVALATAPDIAPTSGVQLEKTPVPTTTTPTVPTPSYDNKRTPGLYQKAKDEEANLEEVYKTARMEADQYAARMRQARLDAIETAFGPRIAEAQKTGQDNLSRVSALNFKAGVIGSGVDTTKVGAQTKENQDVLKAIEDQKAILINEAFGYADKLATERAATLVEEKTKSSEANVARYKDLYDTAVQSIQSFGKAGVTLDQLKNGDNETYKNLKEVAGLSDLEISQMLQEAGNQKYTTTTYDKDNGVIVSYGVDPQTGKPISYVQKVDLPERTNPGDVETINLGGEIALYDKANDKVIRVFKKSSTSSTSSNSKKTVSLSPTDKKKLLGQNLTSNDINKIVEDFNAGYPLDEIVADPGLTDSQKSVINQIFNPF